MLLVSSVTYGSTTAITENGDSVILKEDGTWIFNETQSDILEEIPRNTKKYTKKSYYIVFTIIFSLN